MSSDAFELDTIPHELKSKELGIYILYIQLWHTAVIELNYFANILLLELIFSNTRSYGQYSLFGFEAIKILLLGNDFHNFTFKKHLCLKNLWLHFIFIWSFEPFQCQI